MESIQSPKSCKVYKTIDLWTGRDYATLECITDAFLDGVTTYACPYRHYKVVRNCNCLINCNDARIITRHKHHAIVFYNQKDQPIRLVVINAPKLDEYLNLVPQITVSEAPEICLSKIFEEFNVTHTDVNLYEAPIKDRKTKHKETDLWSVDRYKVLQQAISENFISTPFFYTPNIKITYALITDTEHFLIKHAGGITNRKRAIIFQKDSRFFSKVSEK